MLDFRKLVAVLAQLLLLTQSIFAQDILGCGGFVRSEVEINYSLVEVKLYTKQGSLKYQTDCAPHSGYYMIPVYDKGDYVLKVEPPPGWTFKPESVDLSIDGATDACSRNEDINFQFTGFGVVGKVISRGQSSGPAGVTLYLSKVKSSDVLQTTGSLEGGAFTFDNVLPGEYTVTAHHPVWKFDKERISVVVDRETGNAGSELTVRGYDVTGRVTSEGEPINGVNFLLFSDNVKQNDVSGCDGAAVRGYPAGGAAGVPGSYLCHVLSEESGLFSFPSLPYGDYSVVPFYRGDEIFFDVVPASLAFSVRHTSVTLEQAFDVAGFSVQGRVLNSKGGSGLAGVRILLNDLEQAVTRDDGSYHLEGMKTGTYKLEAKVAQMTFEAVEVKVTPNTPRLPDLIAGLFSVCGRIIIDKIPEGLSHVQKQRHIVMSTIGARSDAMRITTDVAGNFCADVAPGSYSLEVVLTEPEKKAGLKLAPAVKDVMVTNAPVNGITFSQFRARVGGTVSCLETCGVISLSLTPISRSDERLTTKTANEVSKGASFLFHDVMPGKYKVSLHQEEWCWQEKSLDLEVVDADVTVNFQQSGYILTCSLSHGIKLNFEHAEQSGVVGEFELPKGVNKFCLAEPGVYSLKPQSCHQFEKEAYRYDTSAPTVLTLTAVKHLAEGTIVTAERRQDITVTIKTSSESEAPATLGPLVSDKEPIPAKNKTQKPTEQKGPFTYKFSHWARTGETLSISAASAELLFYPPTSTVAISGDVCPGVVATLEGRQGVFIEGKITPPLEGVEIEVFAADDLDNRVVSMATDSAGQCRVGPLHGDVKYTASAEKDGYILTPVEGKLGHFKAFKLGQITVTVADDAGALLPGVLLSMSGETRYRSNKLTQDNGAMEFGSLSPGKYFLRPMMKEYTFEPSSQMVDVLEGSSIPITVTGKRVAFSCYGHVTSLNGEPEAGVIVEAVGLGSGGSCLQLQEEGKSEPDGSFRIRGLQPQCQYEVRLKQDREANAHIERSTPKSRTLQVIDADITGVRIIAFRRLTQMDISGNIICSDPAHLSSLRVTFYRDLTEDQLDSAKLRELTSISISAATFFYLPAVTIDNKNYVLRLDSSLPRSSYDYTPQEFAFSANATFKHVTFHFNPKPRSVEQELKPSSFLIIPLTGLLILLAYHYQKLVPLVSSSSSTLQGFIQNKPGSMSQSTNAPIHLSHRAPTPEHDNDGASGDPGMRGKRKARKV